MRFRMTDDEALNRELLGELERMRGNSKGVKKSNRGGWHSEGNLFDCDLEAVERVKHAAREVVYELTSKVTSKVEPTDFDLKLFGWMNANPTGGFNAPHSHPGAHWSGVYYVSQPEPDGATSGMIEFLDPRSGLPNWRLLKSRAFKSKRKMRPKAGELIIFPSYLVHWVYPNSSKEERVTIAFNATFKKRRATSTKD